MRDKLPVTILAVGLVALAGVLWTAPKFVRAGAGGVIRVAFDERNPSHRGRMPEVDWTAVSVRSAIVVLITAAAFLVTRRAERPRENIPRAQAPTAKPRPSNSGLSRSEWIGYLIVLALSAFYVFIEVFDR